MQVINYMFDEINYMIAIYICNVIIATDYVYIQYIHKLFILYTSENKNYLLTLVK